MACIYDEEPETEKQEKVEIPTDLPTDTEVDIPEWPSSDWPNEEKSEIIIVPIHRKPETDYTL